MISPLEQAQQIENGYKDKSGKGTLTYKEKPILRVHWGCSCCDYWDENNESSKGMRIAKLMKRVLNKHIKEFERELNKIMNENE